MYTRTRKTKLTESEKATLEDALSICMERLNGYSVREGTHGELMSLLNRWGYSSQDVNDCIRIAEGLLYG